MLMRRHRKKKLISIMCACGVQDVITLSALQIANHTVDISPLRATTSSSTTVFQGPCIFIQDVPISNLGN